MLIAEILKNGKALILKEENWNQDGRFVADMEMSAALQVNDSSHLCMCGMGAVAVGNAKKFLDGGWVTFMHTLNRWVNPKVETITEGRFIDFYSFNDDDTTTHKDVLDMFDKLIELAERSRAIIGNAEY